MDSQWLEGIVAGTLETPPFIFPSLSLALFFEFSYSDLQLVEYEVFSVARGQRDPPFPV